MIRAQHNDRACIGRDGGAWWYSGGSGMDKMTWNGGTRNCVYYCGPKEETQRIRNEFETIDELGN